MRIAVFVAGLLLAPAALAQSAPAADPSVFQAAIREYGRCLGVNAGKPPVTTETIDAKLELAIAACRTERQTIVTELALYYVATGKPEPQASQMAEADVSKGQKGLHDAAREALSKLAAETKK
jgi:hypothetical protein